jgi:hypothetical protein
MRQGENPISTRQDLEARLENYRKSRDESHPRHRFLFDMLISEIERALGNDPTVKSRQVKAPLAAKVPPTRPPGTKS